MIKYLSLLFLIFVALTASDRSYATSHSDNAPKCYPIAIVGSGAAGTMALKRSILNNRETLLFTGVSKEKKRSRGNWVRKVDNIPGLESYRRTVRNLWDETLADLYHSKLGHKLNVVKESVIAIRKEGELFQLTDRSGNHYLAHYVILATGIMDEQPHIQGSIRPILSYANKQTVAYCLLCDGHRSCNKQTAVIGHSEEAAAAALLLQQRYHPPQLSILTNGHSPQFGQETLERLERAGIVVRQEEIEKVLGNKKKLQGFKLTSGPKVEAQMAFAFLGISPNNQLALQLGAEVDERGLVITDEEGESSIEGLFIAGDLRANSSKQIYSAWQHAVDAVQAIDRRLRAAQSVEYNGSAR